MLVHRVYDGDINVVVTKQQRMLPHSAKQRAARDNIVNLEPVQRGSYSRERLVEHIHLLPADERRLGPKSDGHRGVGVVVARTADTNTALCSFGWFDQELKLYES